MTNTESNAGTAGRQPEQYPVIDSLCLEIKNLLGSLGPSPEVRQHFRNARIEVLKGFRQIIDNRIECLSKGNQPGRKISVE
ncbi:MAG TPA: hypothetical protein VKU01_06395 [Bryobacteraceae bacterium]|nr:hypothetical protein [Bryobacteraceae bacterium]